METWPRPDDPADLVRLLCDFHGRGVGDLEMSMLRVNCPPPFISWRSAVRYDPEADVLRTRDVICCPELSPGESEVVSEIARAAWAGYLIAAARGIDPGRDSLHPYMGPRPSIPFPRAWVTYRSVSRFLAERGRPETFQVARAVLDRLQSLLEPFIEAGRDVDFGRGDPGSLEEFQQRRFVWAAGEFEIIRAEADPKSSPGPGEDGSGGAAP